jgi:predicted RNA polymerase sigma factor
LARIVRDVGLAEDLAQDALVAALEQWPASGVPRNPGAWLMAATKHRVIDLWRRNKRLGRKHEELGQELDAAQDKAVLDIEAAIDDYIGDDLLCLRVTPATWFSPPGRVALPLRLLGGLTTEEIARAFLVSSRRPPRASSVPSGLFPKRESCSRFPAGPSSPPVCRRSSRLSIWSSTKASRRRPAL